MTDDMTKRRDEELKLFNEYLIIEPSTGLIKWKKSTNTKIKAGSICGNKRKNGRTDIQILGKKYLAHYIVWVFFNKKIPSGVIDHINGNPSDNRIDNLRDCTPRQNSQNYKTHRSGKLVGASFNNKRKMWAAQIYINKKNIFLGYYKTEAEAHNVYKSKLNELGETLALAEIQKMRGGPTKTKLNGES